MQDFDYVCVPDTVVDSIQAFADTISGDTNTVGYANNIHEIIGYYDQTDGILNAPELYPNTDAVTISFNMLDGKCDGCGGPFGWIDQGFVKSFEDSYQKWLERQTSNPENQATSTKHE